MPNAYAVILLDREPSDPSVGLPAGEPTCTDKTVELEDRDGNRYVGTLVLAADTYTDASRYVEAGYTSGQVWGRGVDGYRPHEVPKHGLVILGLERRPRAGWPLRFEDAR